SARLVEADLTTEAFAAQHVRITRELLQRRRVTAGAAAPLPLADSRTPSN
ncbi:glycosyltransferase family 1 protein, partial [Burkholderia sp. Tr-860]|nr:glycosyltransferase family 1 protein [Burkholderia sp. Tr-860]